MSSKERYKDAGVGQRKVRAQAGRNLALLLLGCCPQHNPTNRALCAAPTPAVRGGPQKAQEGAAEAAAATTTRQPGACPAAEQQWRGTFTDPAHTVSFTPCRVVATRVPQPQHPPALQTGRPPMAHGHAQERGSGRRQWAPWKVRTHGLCMLLCLKQASPTASTPYSDRCAVLRCVVLLSPAGVLARQGSAGSMDDSSPAALLQHNPAGLSRMRSARTPGQPLQTSAQRLRP